MQEWDAPETKSGMDITVTALEGSGSYHVQAEITGTAERLAKVAILGREVPLQIEPEAIGSAFVLVRKVKFSMIPSKFFLVDLDFSRF